MDKARDNAAVERLEHPNRKLSRSEIEALVEAYGAGEQLKLLSARFGLHEQTVKAHLRRAGVTLRPWPTLSDEQVQRAGQLYGEGWTIVQVAAEFGCDASTMRHSLHRAGVKIRPRGRFRISPADDE